MIETTEKTVETPSGTLYLPHSTKVQFGALAAAVFAGFLVAQAVIWGFGDLSDNGETAVYIAFGAVFFVGYALWTARLQALAFQLVGAGIFKALFLFVVRRRKPESIKELIPSKDKLAQIGVAAQKAASSFVIAGILVTVIAFPISLLFEAKASALERLVILAIGLIGWAYALTYLGRRGYLPIPESD